MTQLLWDLARKARQAESDRELGFLLVNETLAMVPYRQAALWLADAGTWSLSGVVQVDAHVPFVQWFESVCRHLQTLAAGRSEPLAFTAADLPPALADDWQQWWPAHGLWLGSGTTGASPSAGPGVDGGAVFLRETPWTDSDSALLHEWSGVWWHAFAAL